MLLLTLIKLNILKIVNTDYFTGPVAFGIKHDNIKLAFRCCKYDSYGMPFSATAKNHTSVVLTFIFATKQRW